MANDFPIYFAMCIHLWTLMCFDDKFFRRVYNIRLKRCTFTPINCNLFHESLSLNNISLTLNCFPNFL